ncbi:MAG: glycosyltransferase family 2 protein, partial [Candidatus Omnitrophica bacterium]|nr:glycosyltransferase family 2 protein [Candidatus Omnitrophota bacterium]
MGDELFAFYRRWGLDKEEVMEALEEYKLRKAELPGFEYSALELLIKVLAGEQQFAIVKTAEVKGTETGKTPVEQGTVAVPTDIAFTGSQSDGGWKFTEYIKAKGLIRAAPVVSVVETFLNRQARVYTAIVLVSLILDVLVLQHAIPVLFENLFTGFWFKSIAIGASLIPLPYFTLKLVTMTMMSIVNADAESQNGEVIPAEDLPYLTIQVPGYNEPAEIMIETIKSAMQLSYPKEKLQIQVLDDSTDSKSFEPLEAFSRSNNLDYIRRIGNSRRGFKAGALNDALKSARGEIILVLDAETYAQYSAESLSRVISEFIRNPRLGWIQTNVKSSNFYEKNLSTIRAVFDKVDWEVLSPFRSAYGFAPLKGRGVFVLKAAIENVGGWAENSVIEDTATSIKLRNYGYQGKFAAYIATLEKSPESFDVIRGQMRRYNFGMTKLIRDEWRTILYSRNMRWFEKVDIVSYLVGSMFLVPSMIIVFSSSLYWATLDLLGAQLYLSQEGLDTVRFLSNIFSFVLANIFTFGVLYRYLVKSNGYKVFSVKDLVIFASLTFIFGTALLPDMLTGTLKALKNEKGKFVVSNRAVITPSFIQIVKNNKLGIGLGTAYLALLFAANPIWSFSFHLPGIYIALSFIAGPIIFNLNKQVFNYNTEILKSELGQNGFAMSQEPRAMSYNDGGDEKSKGAAVSDWAQYLEEPMELGLRPAEYLNTIVKDYEVYSYVAGIGFMPANTINVSRFNDGRVMTNVYTFTVLAAQGLKDGEGIMTAGYYKCEGVIIKGESAKGRYILIGHSREADADDFMPFLVSMAKRFDLKNIEIILTYHESAIMQALRHFAQLKAELSPKAMHVVARPGKSLANFIVTNGGVSVRVYDYDKNKADASSYVWKFAGISNDGGEDDEIVGNISVEELEVFQRVHAREYSKSAMDILTKVIQGLTILSNHIVEKGMSPASTMETARVAYCTGRRIYYFSGSEESARQIAIDVLTRKGFAAYKAGLVWDFIVRHENLHKENVGTSDDAILSMQMKELEEKGMALWYAEELRAQASVSAWLYRALTNAVDYTLEPEIRSSAVKDIGYILIKDPLLNYTEKVFLIKPLLKIAAEGDFILRKNALGIVLGILAQDKEIQQYSLDAMDFIRKTVEREFVNDKNRVFWQEFGILVLETERSFIEGEQAVIHNVLSALPENKPKPKVISLERITTVTNGRYDWYTRVVILKSKLGYEAKSLLHETMHFWDDLKILTREENSNLDALFVRSSRADMLDFVREHSLFAIGEDKTTLFEAYASEFGSIFYRAVQQAEVGRPILLMKLLVFSHIFLHTVENGLKVTYVFEVNDDNSITRRSVSFTRRTIQGNVYFVPDLTKVINETTFNYVAESQPEKPGRYGKGTPVMRQDGGTFMDSTERTVNSIKAGISEKIAPVAARLAGISSRINGILASETLENRVVRFAALGISAAGILGYTILYNTLIGVTTVYLPVIMGVVFLSAAVISGISLMTADDAGLRKNLRFVNAMSLLMANLSFAAAILVLIQPAGMAAYIFNIALGFINVSLFINVTMSVRGDWTPLNIFGLKEDGLKSNILRLVKTEDKETIGRLIENINDINLLRWIFIRLSKQAKVTPYKNDKDVPENFKGLMDSTIGIVQEFGQAYYETWKSAKAFLGEHKSPVIQSLVVVVAFAQLLKNVITIFFSGKSMSNTERLRMFEQGELTVDNAEEHVRSVILEAKNGYSRTDKVQDAWYALSWNIPVLHGNVGFIVSRVTLAVLSGYLGHPIAMALTSYLPAIDSFTSVYAVISGIYEPAGIFMANNLQPVWSEFVSIFILNYLLTLISGARQIKHGLADLMVKFGLPTAELETLLAAVRKTDDKTEKKEYIRRIMQAHRAGQLYSRKNPYLFNLLSDEAYLTGLIEGYELAIEDIALEDIVEALKNTEDHEELVESLQSEESKRQLLDVIRSFQHDLPEDLIVRENVSSMYYLTNLAWIPALAMYLAIPFIFLPAGIIAGRMGEQNSKGRNFMNMLFVSGKGFWSGFIGLATIGLEIGIAQAFAIHFGGVLETFVGPWEGSNNFRHPILGIGSDISGTAETTIARYTGVNVDIASSIYHGFGGQGTLADARTAEKAKALSAMGFDIDAQAAKITTLIADNSDASLNKAAVELIRMNENEASMVLWKVNNARLSGMYSLESSLWAVAKNEGYDPETIISDRDAVISAIKTNRSEANQKIQQIWKQDEKRGELVIKGIRNYFVMNENEKPVDMLILNGEGLEAKQAQEFNAAVSNNFMAILST